MGGSGKYPALLVDPAIEKWYHMKESTHHYYKFNRKSITIAAVLMVGIPALLYYNIQKSIGKYEFRGIGLKQDYYKSDTLKK